MTEGFRWHYGIIRNVMIVSRQDDGYKILKLSRTATKFLDSRNHTNLPEEETMLYSLIE